MEAEEAADSRVSPIHPKNSSSFQQRDNAADLGDRRSRGGRSKRRVNVRPPPLSWTAGGTSKGSSHSSHQRAAFPAPPTRRLRALPAENVGRFLAMIQEGNYAEARVTLRKTRRVVKGRGCSKEAFGGLRAMLHYLLEVCSCGGHLEEALDILRDMKQNNEARLVCAAAFAAMLRGLLSRGALDEIRRVVRVEMMSLGVAVNETALKTLMDAAARAGHGHVDEAWEVLEEILDKGLRADKYVVSILTKGITTYTDHRRTLRSVSTVERFLAAQPGDVDEVLINSLLDVCCRMNDLSRMEATLDRMRRYGIRGSAVTYGTMVKAYGKASNIDKVLEAWSEMGRLNLEPNAVTYGCMLDACVKCGHLDRAMQVFNVMKHRGIHKNTILYATLIKGCAKSKDPHAARELYHEMITEGVPCNHVVFNSLIDACVRAGDLGSAASVLVDMHAANVTPDLITFSTLIKGYCNSGELSKALKLAEELQNRNLKADEIFYNSLLEGCVKVGDLQTGMKLFNQMLHTGVRPGAVTFSILVKLLARAGRLDLAVQLVADEMRRLHGVVPTRMVWSSLLSCCVKARDLTKAVAVLDAVERDAAVGASARVSMYATVIEGALMQSEASHALALVERICSKPLGDETISISNSLSMELLRRTFELAAVRSPAADAQRALDAVASQFGERARSSMKEALVRGARQGGSIGQGVTEQETRTSMPMALSIGNGVGGPPPHSNGVAGSLLGCGVAAPPQQGAGGSSPSMSKLLATMAPSPTASKGPTIHAMPWNAPPRPSSWESVVSVPTPTRSPTGGWPWPANSQACDAYCYSQPPNINGSANVVSGAWGPWSSSDWGKYPQWQQMPGPGFVHGGETAAWKAEGTLRVHNEPASPGCADGGESTTWNAEGTLREHNEPVSPTTVTP